MKIWWRLPYIMCQHPLRHFALSIEKENDDKPGQLANWSSRTSVSTRAPRWIDSVFLPSNCFSFSFPFPMISQEGKIPGNDFHCFASLHRLGWKQSTSVYKIEFNLFCVNKIGTRRNCRTAHLTSRRSNYLMMRGKDDSEVQLEAICRRKKRLQCHLEQCL